MRYLITYDIVQHEQNSKRRTGIITDHFIEDETDFFVVLWDEDDDWYEDEQGKTIIECFDPVSVLSFTDISDIESFTVTQRKESYRI